MDFLLRKVLGLAATQHATTIRRIQEGGFSKASSFLTQDVGLINPQKEPNAAYITLSRRIRGNGLPNQHAFLARCIGGSIGPRRR
jgi:hypothetical protein